MAASMHADILLLFDKINEQLQILPIIMHVQDCGCVVDGSGAQLSIAPSITFWY